MLILIMVPVTAAMTVLHDPQSNNIGWITLQGFIFGLREINGGALIGFSCLFVHYIGRSQGQRVTSFLVR